MKTTAYAIVRIDSYQDSVSIENINIKCIVFDLELAKSEVERLNKLNSHLDCKYFWQMTRVIND